MALVHSYDIPILGTSVLVVLGACFNLNSFVSDAGVFDLAYVLVQSDDIEILKRFQGRSEPFFMFILNKKVTKVFRGVDAMRFSAVAEKELYYFKKQQIGETFDRPTYELHEITPEEKEWFNTLAEETQLGAATAAARRAVRQAARKRHRAELMVPHLQHLNFVLYWPHAIHAHHELYERWDMNNIIMVGREEIQLTKELAEDVFYSGDDPLNEASLHMLLSAPALAICFRLLDTDKNFVALVRKILYEDMPEVDISKDDPTCRQTAFDMYKSFSPSKEEIWQKRREERFKRKEETIEKRARRLSEMQRLAREQIQEAIAAKKARKEHRKLELLKAGNLSALDHIQEEEDDEDIDITIPEELPDEEDVESSEEEDENEYFPPPGLLIPGLYAPPNDIAKTNGLALLFPKLVLESVTPQPEFLPPHIVVMLHISKRYKAIQALSKYKKSIIHYLLPPAKQCKNIRQEKQQCFDFTVFCFEGFPGNGHTGISEMGIFKGNTPYDTVHITYTIKQFDALDLAAFNMEDLKIAFMISTIIDLPILELMELNPAYVSRDELAGEDECANMFCVDYADNYNEFEDFES